MDVSSNSSSVEESSKSVGEIVNVRLSDIYNLLFAGKSIELSFATSAEAENFRVRLHQYKTRQDRCQTQLGMIKEEEVQKLVFRYEATTKVAKLKFQDKPDPRQYSIRIVEDDSADAEV